MTGDGNALYLDANVANDSDFGGSVTDPQNDNHNAVYATAIAVTNGVFIASGNADHLAAGTNVLAGGTSNNVFGRNRSAAGTDTGSLPAAGFIAANRSVSGEYVVRNGESETTASVASETPTSDNILLFRRGSGSFAYGAHTLAFYSIGTSLSLEDLDTAVSNLITRLKFALLTGENPARYDGDTVAHVAESGASDPIAIDALVKYLKAQSLWDYARFYPMKSAQNAGSGSTVYGLGGLTSNNMTLVNSPTWGSDGVTFDGSTNYGKADVTGFGSSDEVLLFWRSSPALASQADTSRSMFIAFGQIRNTGPTGTGGTAIGGATGATSGETWTSQWTFSADPAGNLRRIGSASFAWGAGEDHTTVFQIGNGSALWKNKAHVPLDRNNQIDETTDLGPSDIGGVSDNVFVSGYNFNGTESAANTAGSFAAFLVFASDAQPTAEQRETITDLMNAL